MTIDQRNAYYKGILAARKGLQLSQRPTSYNLECMTLWIAGHNHETQLSALIKKESAMLTSMMA